MVPLVAAPGDTSLSNATELKQTFEFVTWPGTVPVEGVMSDARRVESSTGPRSTQPTLLTLLHHRNPVDSVTRRVGDARCLALLDARCRVQLTVGIVCVRL